MGGWLRLPVDEAVAAWKRRRVVQLVALVVVAVAPLAAVVGAKAAWDAENAEVHATAEVTGIVDDDTVALTWREGARVQEETYAYNSDGGSYEVGDTIDIAYPSGHPEQIHGLQAGAILAATLVVELVFLSNAITVYFLRVRPLGRQIALARAVGGTPVTIELDEDRGRQVRVWLGPHDAELERGPAHAIVRVGGRGRPRHEGPEPAVVRGELRARGTVVVQVGDELLNTYGLVRLAPRDDAET